MTQDEWSFAAEFQIGEVCEHVQRRLNQLVNTKVHYKV